MSRALLAAWSVLLFATACSKQGPHPDLGPIPAKIIEISAEDLAPTHTRSFLGTVTYESSAGLAFEVGGRITEIHVEESAFVEQGTLLARLDDTDFVTALDAARSDFETAEQVHTRSSELAEQGAESQERVEVARRGLETARARLKLAEHRLEQTRLTAPSDGFIGRRIAEVSDSVVAKQPVVVLQDPSALRMRAIIPEQDIRLGAYFLPLADGIVDARPRVEATNRLAIARPRTVLSIYPEREFPCEFVALTTAANPVTRTLTLTMRFDSPGDLLVISGTSARLLLDVPGEQAGLVAIPVVAVYAASDGTQRVWLVGAEGKLAAKPVELGRIVGDQALVGGLAAGDRIVASGVAKLRVGDVVTSFVR